MTTRITVKNEAGTPVNPYKPSIVSGETPDPQSKYWAFEQSVIPHDAPGIPDTKEGEFVEAGLVWQVQNRKGWTDTDDHKYMEGEGFITRQIYRLPQQPKGGPDLKQLEKRIDEFIENTSAEDYKKMFNEMDKEAKEQEKEKTAEESNFGNNNHLKSCPFCSGTEKDHVVMLGYKHPYYRVTCCNCNVVLQDDRKDKVQGKWNDRNGLSWDKADYYTLESTVSELEARARKMEGVLDWVYKWTDDPTIKLKIDEL